MGGMACTRRLVEIPCVFFPYNGDNLSTICHIKRLVAGAIKKATFLRVA